MSRTQCENIFTQAAFSQNVWDVAIKVMDMYQDGQLKDQKLNRKRLQNLISIHYNLFTTDKCKPSDRHSCLALNLVTGKKQPQCTQSTQRMKHWRSFYHSRFTYWSSRCIQAILPKRCVKCCRPTTLQVDGYSICIVEEEVFNVTGQQLCSCFPTFCGVNLARLAICQVKCNTDHIIIFNTIHIYMVFKLI